jgi:hypothetical protein
MANVSLTCRSTPRSETGFTALRLVFTIAVLVTAVATVVAVVTSGYIWLAAMTTSLGALAALAHRPTWVDADQSPPLREFIRRDKPAGLPESASTDHLTQ